MSDLQWLDFEYSEGDDGVGVFDALASVLPQYASAVRAEIDAVLAWAQAEGGQRDPMEEGGDWDAELQASEDTGPPARHEFGLTITGTPGFCEAFRLRFMAADDGAY